MSRPDYYHSTAAFDDIAVTALGTARQMEFSGITPWPEMSAIAQELWLTAGHAGQPALDNPQVNAPGIEVRYRLASRLIENEVDMARQADPNVGGQVLEVASGISPRGLLMTQTDPTLTYVELDLPIMTQLKRMIIDKLTESGTVGAASEKHHIVSGSALGRLAMEEASGYLNPDEPVTVTSEGLLHYLNHDEKFILASRIGTLLRRFGGIWYTDMPHWEGISKINRMMARTTTKQTGRNIPDNRFDNLEDIRYFFSDPALGLEVKGLFSYVEPTLVDSLTSPRHPDIMVPRDEVERANRPWFKYAIGLKGERWELNTAYPPTLLLVPQEGR
jgi:hypothetical protein